MKNIFISSTFIDMQAERDLVQERVLPALREEARKYGDNVGVIDLRWGVDTSTLETEEGAAKVLKVCLDEIDRSHPYMLIFLGERYGTMMREDQIERSIRGREDKYTTDDYVKSITALEVEYGALSEKYGELNSCVVCFREPVVHMLDGEEKDLYAEHKEEGKRKLAALKERIVRDLGKEDRLITYSCTWDASARQLVDFTSNGQPLETVLTDCFTELFRDDWKKYESLSWQDKEQLAFRALMESKLRSFVGREALLEEYYQSITNGTCPIILQGETGSGKTAIMCKLVERLQREGKNVFTFFAGVGSTNNNAESLVKQMVYYMENLLGIEEHFEDTEKAKAEINDVKENRLRIVEKGVQYDDWMERLGELCFKLPEGEKVYFCIDALDQLFLDEHVEKLDFFTRSRNVQVIASCTDEFELPMEAMVKREEKQIPALSEEDAKTVAEGILASYSRNAYVAMEEEILKKKSIGNPLYISLLIQRLNMMDTEELRKAMTEEEIVALGIGIIREMPEETEEALVAVIRNGIDKISEAEELLYEVLEYLAVSRNGLRMSDLQEIFAAKERVLPVLDLTLLMKYLDSFFYVHEDDRIDFTHKAIRQGLLKGLTDREVKEEVIKEHLKALDESDGLRMREGMYFARICKDEEFAGKILGQACDRENEELVKEIKNEAVADTGAFYCRLIEKEIGEISNLRTFFFVRLPEQMGLAKEESRAKLAIGRTMVSCLESLHEKSGSEGSLRELSFSYNNMGNELIDLGKAREALSYYEKALECAEELHEKSGSEESLRDLSISYNHMGRVMLSLGQAREALSYYKKMLECMEILREKSGSEGSLRELSISYNNMGNALEDLGQAREALSYYEKALEIDESLHEKIGSEGSLRDLLVSYYNMGNALEDLGQAREALPYYEKELECAEELHEKIGSGRSLRDLSVSYSAMGRALNHLGQAGEALSYYEKALEIDESLHEKSGSELSLRELLISYNNMGWAMLSLGQAREALPYYEKVFKCAEELHEKNGSELSLRDLSVSYDNMGNALKELGEAREALSYYEKALKCVEELHEKNGSERSLRDLSISYDNMGNTLKDLGQAREALSYCEKALKCKKDLYEKSGSERSLRDLSISYNNMGNTLKDLGQAREALSYCEKALEIDESLHEKKGSEGSLRNLSISYNNMGNALKELGEAREALPYYEKVFKCAEELHEKNGSELSLRELSVSYDNMGNALKELGEAREALSYYEKALKCAEELHEKNGSERSLRDLSISYNNIGSVLCDLNHYEEALEYFAKNMRGREELYRLNTSDSNLSGLSVAYNNYGWILCEIGRAEEAVEYLEKALQYMEELHRKNPTKNRQLALVSRWRNLAKAMLGTNHLTEALEYGKKAVELDRELYSQDNSDKAKERVIKALSIYADALFADDQLKDAYEVSTEALEYCKALCKKKDSIPNIRTYVNVLKGMYLCQLKQGQSSEAEKYLLLAKEEAKKLYKRSGAEKDKKLLDELRSY